MLETPPPKDIVIWGKGAKKEEELVIVKRKNSLKHQQRTLPAPFWFDPAPTPLGFAFYLDSVQFSHSVMSDSLRPHGLQHTRPPCPSPTPGVYPNSCPLSRWCHPTISSCRSLHLLPSIFPNIRLRGAQPPGSNAMTWGGAYVKITEINCTINVRHLNYWKHLPHPRSMEKLLHETGPWCQKDWGRLMQRVV